MSEAQLVISRAGARQRCRYLLIGRPSILIPFGDRRSSDSQCPATGAAIMPENMANPDTRGPRSPTAEAHSSGVPPACSPNRQRRQESPQMVETRT
ncbi:glycosyltransferase [Sulfitobacter pontiacus]